MAVVAPSGLKATTARLSASEFSTRPGRSHRSITRTASSQSVTKCVVPRMNSPPRVLVLVLTRCSRRPVRGSSIDTPQYVPVTRRDESSVNARVCTLETPIGMRESTAPLSALSTRTPCIPSPAAIMLPSGDIATRMMSVVSGERTRPSSRPERS